MKKITSLLLLALLTCPIFGQKKNLLKYLVRTVPYGVYQSGKSNKNTHGFSNFSTPPISHYNINDDSIHRYLTGVTHPSVKFMGKNNTKEKGQEFFQTHNEFKEYEVPKLSPFDDRRNRKQLHDSAFIYLSMADTLNYIKYLKRSVSAGYPLAMYAYGISILGGVGLKKHKDIGLSYINMASDFNCHEATYYIGQLHDLGRYGYKKDSVMALRYYEKSAEQGDFDGAVDTGDRYYNDGDTIKAIKYWKQAYDLKYYSILTEKEKSTMARVAYNMGYFVYCGICVPQDQKAGIDYFKYAAIWGNPDANYFLGLLYAEGSNDVTQNSKMSQEYIRSSARLGCVDGMVLYGNYCMMGYGMEKDSIEAVYWYKNAAQQRHVGAMCALPFLYYDAHENDSTILWGTKPECRDSADIQFIVGAAYYVKEDYENAEEWWKKAATQKYPDALWWMYYLCEVHKNDSVLAFEYLKQAVDAKYPEALNEMGCNYANGDMVGKDVEKAKQLFHEAGSLGFGEAYNNLGYLYSNKDCIKKPNWEIAAGYFRQGAEMNNPSAQYNYGMCLKKGKGVKKDKQAAVHWITLAAQNGDEDAIKVLKGKTK